MTQLTLGIWQPTTTTEVAAIRHPAGLFGATVTAINNFETLMQISNSGVPIVSLEQDTHAIPLGRFMHPEGEAVYLVGPVNGWLPRHVLDLGRVVQVETSSRHPLRPSDAATIALYHRHMQLAGVAA